MVIDDLQQLPIDEETISIPGLLAAANRMESIGRAGRTPGMLSGFGRFIRSVVDLMTGGFGDDPDVSAIEDLDAPEIPSDEVPEQREYRGTNFQHSRVTGHVWGEPIARAKLAYNETVINQMQDGRWEAGDEPLCFDAVIALAVQAGLDSGPAHRAIAVPSELDSCPVCTADLGVMNGKRVCEDCGRDEESGLLVHPDDEPARVKARLVSAEELRDGDDPVVEYRTLPMPDELPDPEDTLILDATPTPEEIGLPFGLDAENVDVTGNEPRELNANITQVANGQYHRSTIGRDDEYGERLRERFQRWIDTRGETCEQFLVVSHKKNRRHFDLPENAEWMHFHAARGLDRSDYDGVIVIGAPHPDIEALERDAELLAMHRDDVRVGGEEHSTRPDAPNPPVYRKLLFEDENGQGRAVPTKHYTGLVGVLFQSGREDEIDQVAHRVRPGQADPDDEKFIDLLSNVPSDLPVDQFVRLEELTDPLSVMLPVPEGALDLLRAIRDAVNGDVDGFRDSADLVDVSTGEDGETDVEYNVNALMRLVRVTGVTAQGQTGPPDRSTVSRWVRDLEAVGLHASGAYEPSEGRRYAADFDALARALQVLSSNVGAKASRIPVLKAKIRDSVDGLDWLEWAEGVFDLTGDRCAWSSLGNGGDSGATHGT